MAIRVAINGFGRTGRAAFRSAYERDADVEWVAVNDVAEPAMLARLLRHDSVYGPFPGLVAAEDGALAVDGQRIAVPAQADGVVVCLGDMPQVDAALIDRLIAAIDPDKGALVAVPTIGGKRGNPVVWSRRFFPDLSGLGGDVGARHLIATYPEAVIEVPVTGRAAFVDVDTPDALSAVKAEFERATTK